MNDTTIKTVTVYESWVQVADKLTDEQKGKFYHAIMHYALYGKKPKLESPLDAFFIFVQPSIDKSNKRKNAGSNGGKKSSKTQANCKQNASKTQAKKSLLDSENKQIVTKEKEKEKEKVKENIHTLTSVIACECERIANLYPKAKIGDFRKVVEAIGNAVQREQDRGCSVNDALALIELGTREYAKAAEHIQKRFIVQATKFYDDGIFNNDPETWVQKSTVEKPYDWRKELPDINEGDDEE